MPRSARIWTGITLIAVAIVLIAAENHFGMVSPSSTSGGPRGMQPLPRIGTTLVIGRVTVETRYVGRQNAIGAASAGEGKHVVIIAVRIVNDGPAAILVDSGDFHLLAGSTVVAIAQPYPASRQGLSRRTIGPRQTVTGYLVFSVPDSATSPTLEYVPRFAPKSPMRWSLP